MKNKKNKSLKKTTLEELKKQQEETRIKFGWKSKPFLRAKKRVQRHKKAGERIRLENLKRWNLKQATRKKIRLEREKSVKWQFGTKYKAKKALGKWWTSRPKLKISTIYRGLQKRQLFKSGLIPWKGTGLILYRKRTGLVPIKSKIRKFDLTRARINLFKKYGVNDYLYQKHYQDYLKKHPKASHQQFTNYLNKLKAKQKKRSLLPKKTLGRPIRFKVIDEDGKRHWKYREEFWNAKRKPCPNCKGVPGDKSCIICEGEGYVYEEIPTEKLNLPSTVLKKDKKFDDILIKLLTYWKFKNNG